MDKTEALEKLELCFLQITDRHEAGDILDEYAQQVSRDVAIKFAKYYKTKILLLRDRKGDYLRSELFDNWKSNQEEQQ